MNRLTTLEDALIDQLEDLHQAEHQLVQILPLMQQRAHHGMLKRALHGAALEAEHHLERLTEIGIHLHEPLSGRACKAVDGLVEEIHELLLEEVENSTLFDSVLMGMAQRLIHYVIAGYTTARAVAKKLDEADVLSHLSKTLEEELQTNKTLSLLLDGDLFSQPGKRIAAEDNLEKGHSCFEAPRRTPFQKLGMAVRMF